MMGSSDRPAVRGPLPAIALRIVLGVALGTVTTVVGAADSPRTWRDASGKFVIEARLIDRTDRTVLLKKADGRVIEVPIDKLAKADRDYLAKLDEERAQREQPTSNPFAVEGKMEPKWLGRRPSTPRPRFHRAEGPPAADNAILPATGRLVPLRKNAVPAGLEPDPLPQMAAVSDGGLVVAEAGAFGEASAPLILDPEKMIVAVALTRRPAEGDDGAGRIHVVTLPNGPAKLAWEDGKSIRLLDHDAASDRTLLVSGLETADRGGDIVVIEGLSRGSPTEVLRRRPPGRKEPGSLPKVEWGRLVDAETMLAVVDGHFFAWNLASAETLFTLGRLDPGARPELSPGRRYLAVPVDKGVVFVDPVKGTSLGFLSPSGLVSRPCSIHFHPDGQRVAVIDEHRIVVHDLVAGEETANFRLDIQDKFTTGSRPPLGWVDEQLLLGAEGHLVRTDIGAVLWKYGWEADSEPLVVPGGLLVSSKDGAFRLTQLRLPSASALRAEEQFEKEAGTLFLTREGIEVSVTADVADGVDRERVLQAIRKAVEQAGWKVVPLAAVSVAGIVQPGTPQQISYAKTTGAPLAATSAGGAAAGADTITVTPFSHGIEVRLGREVVWSYTAPELIPMFVRQKEGESIQAAVERANVPDYGRIEKFEIPTLIPQREYKEGFGGSVVSRAQWDETSLIEPAQSADRPKRRTKRPTGPRPLTSAPSAPSAPSDRRGP